MNHPIRKILVAAAHYTAMTHGAGAQFALDSSVVAGGGGASSGGTYALTGTVGQPDALKTTQSELVAENESLSKRLAALEGKLVEISSRMASGNNMASAD